jgi:potassium-transporting ATPase ATP-binding subunit
VVFPKLARAFAKRRRRARVEAPRPMEQATELTAQDGRKKAAGELIPGDVVVVAEGETIPADGIVIQGSALIDESAITGESAPVLRESASDRKEVIRGTRVLSSRIVVKVTSPPDRP